MWLIGPTKREKWGKNWVFGKGVNLHCWKNYPYQFFSIQLFYLPHVLVLAPKNWVDDLVK